MRRLWWTIGAGSWLVQPLYVVAELVAVAFVDAPYSFRDSTISDLGAITCTSVAYPFGDVPVCSPAGWLVNGSFVLFGILLAVGAVVLRPVLGPGAAGAWATALWVVAGLSSIATGLVPIDVDLGLHALVSTPVFVAQPVALLGAARALRCRRTSLARGAAAAGVVSLVAAAVFLARTDQQELGGALERLCLWPAYAWTCAAAISVVRERRSLADGHRA